jgi:hypothetical protein
VLARHAREVWAALRVAGRVRDTNHVAHDEPTLGRLLTLSMPCASFNRTISQAFSYATCPLSSWPFENQQLKLVCGWLVGWCQIRVRL